MLIFALINLTLAQRILIIGCGVGGSSLAEILKTKDQSINVQIYDPEECGGRIDHIKYGEDLIIETGGTIYIKENKYVQQYVEKYGLTSEKYEPGSLGIFNETMLFESSSYDILTTAKMVYRYGLAPKYLQDLTSDALENFQNIYQFLEDGKYFEYYQQFLEIIKQTDKKSIRQVLQQQQINDLFVDEFITSIMNSIYNQGTEINSVAGMVSLIAVFTNSFTIKGGNRQFIQENSKYAPKYPIKVNTIQQIDNRYRINGNEEFDIVIIATLLPGIELIGDELEKYSKIIESHKGQDAHVYIITGLLKNIYSDSTAPNTLIIINAGPLKEVLLICSGCAQNKNIYKIQATQALALEQYFDDFEIIKYEHWNPAYPNLSNLDFPNYEISKNLYYLNSMEYIASCMEMEIISARNIANRILSQNKRKDDL